MSSKKISIVVSVYNEEAVLEAFKTCILKELSKIKYSYEVIFVNDGSKDDSENILYSLAKENSNFKVIHFSRNFGHESAMIAGIDESEGDLVICMDADLQNPPEEIHRIIAQYEIGNEIILMARMENKAAGFRKNLTSKMFYGAFNAVSSTKFHQNVSDFFGMSKRVAQVLKDNYREVNRYLRGYIQNIGYPCVILEYKANDRFAGHSKYTFKKLFNVAMDALTCFSKTPLRAGLYVGGISGILSVFLLLYYVGAYIMNGMGNGMILLCFFLFLFFTVLFLVLGIMGEYISVLLAEVKGRPSYLIKYTQNTKAFIQEEIKDGTEVK